MLEIKKAGIEDLSDIIKLEKECFVSAWEEEMLLYDILSGYSSIALVDKQVAGYISVQLIYDEAHIRKLCVSPALRRQGVAACLLKNSILETKKCGAQGMTLEVRSRNKGAIDFYLAQGFVSEGVRPHYYGDDDDDALIMWKRGLD